MKIAFWGDFVCQSPEVTKIDESLRAQLNRSDFNVINFEAPINVVGAKSIHKSGPNICQPVESARWLEEQGFNVIALANNHLLDFGIDSAKATKEIFHNIHTVGLGSGENAYNSIILEHDNIQVGVMSVTHREFSCVEDYGYGCAWMLSPNVTQGILKIKKEVDYLLILNHGGLEYFEQPLPQYRDLYRYWIDMGVDAVFASHPHVPQGWEEYNGKPIFYSLGNFLFEKTDNIYPQYWNNSLMVTLTIESSSLSYQVTPLLYSPNNHTVLIDDSIDTNNLICEINNVLRSDERYLACINEKMQALRKDYEYMLNVGKYSRIGFNLGSLKSIARYFIRRNADSVHHLNLYRCETHRWVMEYLLSHNIL